MDEPISAIYEGDRTLKLAQEPEGVRENEPVMVIVVPIPAESTEFEIEDIGLRGLLEHLRGYERKYGTPSDEFYRRFVQGEVGDADDFILWAGAYEIYQRLAPGQVTPAAR